MRFKPSVYPSLSVTDLLTAIEFILTSCSSPGVETAIKTAWRGSTPHTSPHNQQIALSACLGSTSKEYIPTVAGTLGTAKCAPRGLTAASIPLRLSQQQPKRPTNTMSQSRRASSVLHKVSENTASSSALSIHAMRDDDHIVAKLPCLASDSQRDEKPAAASRMRMERMNSCYRQRLCPCALDCICVQRLSCPFACLPCIHLRFGTSQSPLCRGNKTPKCSVGLGTASNMTSIGDAG